MPNKHFVFDYYAFTDKAVTGNLATFSDERTLLHFHERAEPRFVSNRAPIQVHEAVDGDISAQPHIGRDNAELTFDRHFCSPDRNTSSSSLDCDSVTSIRNRGARSLENFYHLQSASAI